MSGLISSSAQGSAWRRFRSLFYKESLQVLRDPSALIIAFVLPPVLLFLFGNAISLELRSVPIGVVMELDGEMSRELAAAYAATDYLAMTPARDRRELEHHLVSGRLKALVIIPQDFDAALRDPSRQAAIQVITDGSHSNTAKFIAAYTQGVYNNWLAQLPAAAMPPVQVQQRLWFNPELDSNRAMIPGAMAVVMTLIGTLLTALVVAREWERGTMEAVLSTPSRQAEIIASKVLPYFLLGLVTALGCVLMTTVLFEVPLRGSVAGVLALTAAFLVPALGQGLLISTATKSQFNAAQAAVTSGFMPSMLLSGFIYDIESMPTILQYITVVIPARYYVEGLRTVFLVGDSWELLWSSVAALLLVGVVFFVATIRLFRRGLD